MKKILWSIGVLAPAATIAATIGVSLKANGLKTDYIEDGKKAFSELVAQRQLVTKPGATKRVVEKTPGSEFVDEIPKALNADKSNGEVTFIFQRMALSPLTEMVSYALLSQQETYMDAAFNRYDYNAIAKVNSKLILSRQGVAAQRMPSGWLEAARKAKEEGKKVKVILTPDRLDFGAGDSPLRAGNELLKIADKVILLEDGTSNSGFSWTKEHAKAIYEGKAKFSDNFYNALGNFEKNNDYSLFGYSGIGTKAGDTPASMAANFLPKFKMFYTGAVNNYPVDNSKEKKSFVDLGYGNIDQSRLAHELFSHHDGTCISGRPMVGLRAFFDGSTDMIKDINSKRDGRKIYMMLGTYGAKMLGDNFKDGFAKFYRDNKDEYQIFWKGHPDADGEGTWIRDVFMKDGWTVDGKLIKPSSKDLIILNPEAAAETLYDLRENPTDTPEFSWDAYGTIQLGSKNPHPGWTSAITTTPWDKFKDVIWLDGATSLDTVTPGEFAQNKH